MPVMYGDWRSISSEKSLYYTIGDGILILAVRVSCRNPNCTQHMSCDTKMKIYPMKVLANGNWQGGPPADHDGSLFSWSSGR